MQSGVMKVPPLEEASGSRRVWSGFYGGGDNAIPSH
jgi:hypothetical protein